MSNELNFKKLGGYLLKNHKNSSLILLFIFLISSLLESFSIATLIPIISVILNKDLENNTLNILLREKMNLDLSFLFSEAQLFVDTYCSRSVRYDLNHDRQTPLMP